MGFYTSEENIENSLKLFSQGDTFSLFKLALKSIYEPRLLKDTNFIIDMLRTGVSGDNKKEFLELLIDKNMNFGEEHKEENPSKLKEFNDYWKGALEQPVPLLFSIIPYLNDDQLEHVIKEGSIYRVTDREDIKKLAESFAINLFEKGYGKSIIAMKDNYHYFFNSLNTYEAKIYPGQTEEKSLDDIITPYAEDHPQLLPAIAKFFYNSLDSSSNTWLGKQLDKERRDNVLIQKFFDTVFDQLSDNGKEEIIAKTLYKTNDLDFTMIALKRMGVENFNDYKPKHCPLWLDASDHKNKSIYRKFLRSGVSVFDYYKGSNRTFLSVIVDGNRGKQNLKEILEEQKVDYKTFIRELFEKRIDSEGKEYNNFSLLISCGDSSVIDKLNLKFEDIANYSKKFSPERYEKLKFKEKFELLNELMDKTFLADTYVPPEYYYKRHIEKKAINFNLYINNQYFSRNSIFLVDEHLKLLEQVDNNVLDYRGKYFKIISQIFDHYGTSSLETSNELYKTYSKMIDYVATDKSLDWNTLAEHLSGDGIVKDKPNFYEGALELYNYLQKVCLSHTLKPSNTPERKKIKI
jgi:hypothetical protein